MLQIRPAAEGHIGGEIIGLNIENLTKQDTQAILDAVYRDKLVVIRDQHLDTHQYINLAKMLGTPQIYFQENYHHKQHPEIFVSSNVLENGEKVGVPGTGQYWHTDCAFFDAPLPLTMVYPQIIPPSVRYTNYIDLEMVYNKLPEHLKAAIADKNLVHEAKWRYKVQACDVDKSIIDIMSEFQKITPAVEHPAVLTHPVTGKQSLYASEGFTTGVADLPAEQSQQVLQEILAFIDKPEHVHVHHWQEGDILLWDNRPLIHKASPIPKGEESKSYRIGVIDDFPFYNQ